MTRIDEKNKQGGDTDVLRDKERPESTRMDDEMLPDKGQPVKQQDSGGNRPDSAGQHGDMAPGTAKGLDEAGERSS